MKKYIEYRKLNWFDILAKILGYILASADIFAALGIVDFISDKVVSALLVMLLMGSGCIIFGATLLWQPEYYKIVKCYIKEERA